MSTAPLPAGGGHTYGRRTGHFWPAHTAGSSRSAIGRSLSRTSHRGDHSPSMNPGACFDRDDTSLPPAALTPPAQQFRNSHNSAPCTHLGASVADVRRLHTLSAPLLYLQGSRGRSSLTRSSETLPRHRHEPCSRIDLHLDFPVTNLPARRFTHRKKNVHPRTRRRQLNQVRIRAVLRNHPTSPRSNHTLSDAMVEVDATETIAQDDADLVASSPSLLVRGPRSRVRDRGRGTEDRQRHLGCPTAPLPGLPADPAGPRCQLHRQRPASLAICPLAARARAVPCIRSVG